MFEWILMPEAWISLATLTFLEIVLGIDNIIFISILVAKLPKPQRNFARNVGLMLAMISRLALLFSIAWLAKLTTPLFEIFSHGFSGRDLILIIGGLFLMAKATHEIHSSLEVEEENKKSTVSTLLSTLVQITILDIVFSLDSVITAVGLADYIMIMAIAIILSVGVMLIAAKPINEFVEEHPTIKILALSFLILVGVTLMIEGFEVHIPKGYIYFAMAFSVLVEFINIKIRKVKKALHLHKKIN